MPVMAHHFEEIDGKPHVIDDGACNLGIAVDVERKDAGRTLMVPVIRDAGRLTFREFLDAFGELIAKARENKLGADDLQGANLSLTNPGGIGTIASVPRLMKGQGTLVATGAIGYPPGLAAVGAMIGAEKVMTMTSTYDHRIIQGAESGQFLAEVEAYLQGDHDFYERIFADVDAPVGAVPPPPAPAAAAAAQRAAAVEQPTAAGGLPVAPDEVLLQAVQAATSVLKAHRKAKVGTLLLTSLEEEARRRGVTGIMLHAQLYALEFYKRHGYEALGTVFQEAGIDHLEMRKKL